MQLFVKLDLQGKYFNFYLPDGNLMYRTSLGGIVCLMLLLTWLAFAVNQFIVLSQRSDYQILEKSYENFFSNYNFRFKRKDGFAIAAAFVDFKDESVIEDPEIGQLKFYYKRWDDSNETKLEFEEIPQRLCTMDDLNGASDYGLFTFKTNSTEPQDKV